jgi:hypothetical protein
LEFKDFGLLFAKGGKILRSENTGSQNILWLFVGIIGFGDFLKLNFDLILVDFMLLCWNNSFGMG